MSIQGFHKLSTVDYPKNPCSVLFHGGCNFKCPYCHNRSLVNEESPPLNREDLLFQLRRRKKYIKHICISGGEPTLDKALFNDIQLLKNEGFSIKLDTNGSNVKVLKDLIDHQLIDYIAMDIKTSMDQYHRVSNCSNHTGKIKESIALIKESGINYEFRTTFVKGVINWSDLEGVKEMIKGSMRFRIQQGRIDENVLNSHYPMEQYSIEEMNQISDFFTSSAEEIIKSYK